MSTPTGGDGEEETRPRGFLESPRWMDGVPAGCAAPMFLLAGIVAAVAATVVLLLGATGHLSAARTAPISALLLLAATVGILLYRGTNRRGAFADRPPPAQEGRLFRVVVVTEGGKLKQAMEPSPGAFLVVEDDHLRLLYRPMTQYAMACGLALWILLQGQNPVWLLLAWVLCAAVSHWTAYRRRDLRIPWERIHASAASGRRFRLETEVDWHPEGILLEVSRADRDRLAALLAAKTRFEDLGATPHASVQPRDRSTIRR